MPPIQNDVEFVLRTVEERDVHFIQFWFTDVLGNLKSFAATSGELEDALVEGLGFDGSSVEGFSAVEESDCVALPDPDTFQILPWRPKQQGAARMFCDIKAPNGETFEGDPRAVLRRLCDAAADKGYVLSVSPAIEHFYFASADDIKAPNGETFEGDPRAVLRRLCDAAADKGYVLSVSPAIEHFYFASADSPEPLDCGGYFDLMPLDSGNDLRRDTVLMLERLGIPVEYSHHEAAPSQHEIVLRYADAFSMADAVMTHRLVVKQVAQASGCYATFMPKPIEADDGSGMHLHLADAFSMADAVMTHRLVVKQVAQASGCYATFMPKPIEADDGSGMHLHLALHDLDGENLFYDADDPDGYQLSTIAKQFMAGLLKYAPEYTLLTNQYVNSYKRFVRGFDDADDPDGYQLSTIAKQFMAGLLKYAPEYTLLTNQYVNSYKRFVRGFDAPLYVTWAQANRSALVRVPHHKPGKNLSSRLDLRSPDPACNPYLAFAAPLYVTWAQANRSALVRVPHHKPGKNLSSRLDLRSPDPACNPYLAFAGVFAAGLAGIEEKLELPPAMPVDVMSLSEEELDAAGIQRLPQTLGRAIDRFEGSELMRRVLGDHVFEYIVRAKKAEWADYCSHVGQWEIDQFLPVL